VGFFLVSPDLSRSPEMLSDSWTLELTYDYCFVNIVLPTGK